MRLRIMFTCKGVIVVTTLVVCCRIGFGERPCEPLDLANVICSLSEICDEMTRTCRCSDGYVRYNLTSCVRKSDKSDGGLKNKSSKPNSSSLVDDQGENNGLVAGVFVPLILVTCLVCGVYLARKFRVLDWVRKRIARRNENYDEFMIGHDLDDDDDPPLR